MKSTITPVLDRMGLSLVMGTFRQEGAGKVLRLMVERRGATPESGSGVDVGLCALVSRELGTHLDVSEVINDTYTLEVSSPGVERPLVGLSDFERFSGRRIKIKTEKAYNGSRSFDGMLNGVEDDAVVLTTNDKLRISIPNKMIKRANLVFDFKR